MRQNDAAGAMCVGDRGGGFLVPRGVVSRDDDDLEKSDDDDLGLTGVVSLLLIGVVSPAPRRLANGDLYFNSEQSGSKFCKLQWNNHFTVS